MGLCGLFRLVFRLLWERLEISRQCFDVPSVFLVQKILFKDAVDIDGVFQPAPQVEEYVVPEEAYSKKNAESEPVVEEPVVESIATPRISRRWTFKEEKDLVGYYQAGMTIDQLAKLFGKDEEAVKVKLAQKGINI